MKDKKLKHIKLCSALRASTSKQASNIDCDIDELILNQKGNNLF